MNTKDLTVVYYTANRINQHFATSVRTQLLTAIGDTPLISVSKKPIDFGINICDGDTESSVISVYKAVLAGAKAAQTKYVALAEDDTLYSPEHFTTFRPADNAFAYNLSRWSIFTWSQPPFFNLYPRRILATMIAPRDLLIEAIEERFTKYPDSSKIPKRWMCEPGRSYEKNLGVTPRNAVDFYSYVPVVVFFHPEALGYQTLGTRKKAGVVRALEIPYWGTAQRVIKDFYI